MSHWKILALLTLILTVPSCWVVTLHPLHSEQALTVEPAIVGSWSSGEDHLVITNSGNHEYLLAFHEKGTVSYFDLHLARLGPYLFWDLYPRENGCEENSMSEVHRLPVHSFARIQVTDDTLTIWTLDTDWMERQIKAGDLDVKHENIDGVFLITAPTQDLQGFLRRHAEDSGAFEKDILKRSEGVEVEP